MAAASEHGATTQIAAWIGAGLAVRDAHASEGDHRDRAAVGEWAATIARELHQLAPQSSRIQHPHQVQQTQ